jgi:hypothetical protein
MKRFFSILLGGLLLSATFTAWAAGTTGPPIISWQPPASYKAPSSGRTALTDLTPPMPFVPVAPCRQYSTLLTTKLADNTPRTVTLSGAPCGIPASARAVAVNITIFNIAAGSNGVFKVDINSPPTVAWINYPPTETQRGNAGVLSAGTAADIVVQINQGGGTVDFVVDVFGWYGGIATRAFSVENDAVGGEGIVGFETGASGIGVYGSATGTGGIGIYGQSTSAIGFGVQGYNAAGVGVEGDSDSGIGVKGDSQSNHGVQGVTAALTGVAGVKGFAGTANGALGPAYVAPFGVIGIANGSTSPTGVIGIATAIGVTGTRVDATNTTKSFGYLGFSDTDGIYTAQHLTAVGGKSFAEPHPADASKVIKYVCPEGPESGTYFRGRGRFEGHTAVIDVPEHFRIVTDEEGLTVQVTPIGQATAVGVVQIGLDRIVVKSNLDVEFSYLVQGVRKAYKDWQPVQNVTAGDNAYFVPLSASQRLESFWVPEIRQRLISNGTYNTDGTVNMQTAEKMGWAQRWRDAEAEAKAAQQAAAAKAN